MSVSITRYTLPFSICALLFLLSAPGAVSAAPSLSLSKQNWDTGPLKAGTVVKQSVTIRNTGDAPLEITARPSCECISVSSSGYTVPPGGAVDMVVSFSAGENSAYKAYYVFFQTNDPANRLALFLIESAEIVTDKKDIAPPATAEPPVVDGEPPAASSTGIEIYGTPGCGHCDRLMKVTIPALAKKYGIRAPVKMYPLDVPKNFERLVTIEERFAGRSRRLPAVLVGDTLLEGKEEIDRRLEKEIAALADAGHATGALSPGNETDVQGRIAERIGSLRPLPLIVAGLTDGINPCAFAGMIFLVSYIGFVRKRQFTTVALTGIMFIAGIFVIYFLIGLGLSRMFLAINSLPAVSRIVYILAGVATLVLAFLSFHDYYAVARPGKRGAMILQLPSVLRTKIYSLIETCGSSKYIVPVGFLLGVGISFLEFFCTGQIYLPTIMYMVSVPSLRTHAILYLVLYSFVFVLPLILILVSLLVGLKNDRIAGLGKKHIQFAKLLTGFVFLALSFLIFVFAFR